MNTTDKPRFLTCQDRYDINQTGIEPLSVSERYPDYQLLAIFMPGTLLVVRLLMISWLTIGIFGNTLSFAIWVTKHQRRKSTSAYYLSALALTDLLLILTLVNYHMERYWGLTGVKNYVGVCHIYLCVNMLTQYYSTTLVFGFTLERYLAVCFPFKHQTLCSPRRSMWAIIILLLICVFPVLFHAALWTYENGICRLRMELNQDPRVKGTLLAIEIVFSFIVPLSALVLNILVLREMRRLIRRRSTPRPSVSGRKQASRKQSKVFLKQRTSSTVSNNPICAADAPEDKSQQESSAFIATTFMLVILSFFLIACAILPGVFFIDQFSWSEPDGCLTDERIKTDPEWHTFFSRIQGKEMVDVLCASHYALNVVIYLLTLKGFREHAKWILTCQVAKLKSLSRPVTESWNFPRRTAPRLLSTNSTNPESNENHTLITDSKPSYPTRPNGNG